MEAMYRTLGLAGLLAALACLGSAAQVQGVLMDKMCSAEAAKKGQKFAASHDTKCALDAACQKSGYGVFRADNKLLALDAAGNATGRTADVAPNTDQFSLRLDHRISAKAQLFLPPVIRCTRLRSTGSIQTFGMDTPAFIPQASIRTSVT